MPRVEALVFRSPIASPLPYSHCMCGTALVEESCKVGCALEGRVLKIDIDGMDQAKFKVPRNLEATHSFAALWRPVLHVTCAIAHGLVEASAYGHKLAYLYKIAYMVRGTWAYF